MRKIIIFIFFSIGVLNAQISKAGQSGAKFLSLPYDVRSESMGDAGVSLSSYSPFLNPSIISTLNLKTLYGLAGFFWGVNNFAISYIVPSKRGNLAFWTSGVYVGGMEGYELDPYGNINSIGNFSYLATQLGFTFSKFLTDKFSFGISPKIIYEGFGGFSNAYSIALDVGTYYITGFKDLVIAASIRNFGFDMKPSGQYIRYLYEADLVETTATYTSYRLPTIFSFGLSLSILSSAYGKILLAYQLNHPTDNLESHNIGLEYSLMNIIFIRTGYKIYVNSSEAVNGANGINLGLGVNYGRIGLDYGFYNKGILPPINQIAIHYKF